MNRLIATPSHKTSFRHKTHRSVIIRFVLIVLIFSCYFLFVSQKYGYANGFLVSWLSWSFFVFCTPIADAGMLIDFPVRMITKLKMVYSEMAVWLVATGLNIYALNLRPEAYKSSQLLELFHHILTKPWPLWIIIMISAVGTFLSIRLGDELLDVIHHKDLSLKKKHQLKLRVIAMIFILAATFVIYDFLLHRYGISI